MADTIRHRRGNKSGLPVLLPGEIGLCTDTGELFIGGAAGNIPVLTLSRETGQRLGIDGSPAEGSGSLITSGAVYAVRKALEQAVAEVEKQEGPRGEVGPQGERGPQGEQGPSGEKGAPGADGVSPQVSVVREGRAVTITVTDAFGVHTAVIRDGTDAPDDIDCGTF